MPPTPTSRRHGCHSTAHLRLSPGTQTRVQLTILPQIWELCLLLLLIMAPTLSKWVMVKNSLFPTLVIPFCTHLFLIFNSSMSYIALVLLLTYYLSHSFLVIITAIFVLTKMAFVRNKKASGRMLFQGPIGHGLYPQSVPTLSHSHVSTATQADCPSSGLPIATTSISVGSAPTSPPLPAPIPALMPSSLRTPSALPQCLVSPIQPRWTVAHITPLHLILHHFPQLALIALIRCVPVRSPVFSRKRLG